MSDGQFRLIKYLTFVIDEKDIFYQLSPRQQSSSGTVNPGAFILIKYAP